MPIGFHPFRAWRALWRADAQRPAATGTGEPSALKAAYVAYVEKAKETMPHKTAMEFAVGDWFATVGPIEVALLRHYGLPADGHLVDVGCGSGRLVTPLSGYLTGTYLGLDLVPDLVDHARKIAGRPDWRFEVVDHISIPETDGKADMVCFFSVLTHLLHEQSYWYLQEAKRVLKPGGRIVFSFLEFHEPGHMPIFWHTLRDAKANAGSPLNVFIERNAIQRWADALAMEVVDLRDGGDDITGAGALGQSVCVLRKPD